MLKYYFQEDIFSKIDSPEKAYWLGFLYADGYITQKGIFGIALAEKDKEHLIKFLSFLKLSPIENCVKYNNKTKSYRIDIGRKKTYNDLIRLGFTINKSYENNIIIWNNIPIKYKKFFIIGMWDGDGCFSITPSGKTISSLISNNRELLLKITEYINLYLGEKFSKIKEKTSGDPYYRIRFSQNKAKIFGEWFYSSYQPYFLARKYETYLKFEPLKSKANYGFDNPRTKGIYCLESNKYYITAKECALLEFNLTNPGALNTIRAVCRGERAHYKGKHFRYITEKEKEALK